MRRVAKTLVFFTRGSSVKVANTTSKESPYLETLECKSGIG